MISGDTYHLHVGNDDEIYCLLSLSLLCRRFWDILLDWKNLPACLAEMLRHLPCIFLSILEEASQKWPRFVKLRTLTGFFGKFTAFQAKDVLQIGFLPGKKLGRNILKTVKIFVEIFKTSDFFAGYIDCQIKISAQRPLVWTFEKKFMLNTVKLTRAKILANANNFTGGPPVRRLEKQITCVTFRLSAKAGKITRVYVRGKHLVQNICWILAAACKLTWKKRIFYKWFYTRISGEFANFCRQKYLQSWAKNLRSQ